MKEILGEVGRWREAGREGRRRDRRRHAPVGAAARRHEPRRLRVGEDVRLGLGRLRRVGRLRERAGGDGDGRAEAAQLRDRGRGGVGSACPAAARSTSSWSASSDRTRSPSCALGRARRAVHGRRGRRRGAKQLVVEGGERLGDGVPDEALAQFDEVIRRGRNQLLELDDGSKVFAEWYGPPPRLSSTGRSTPRRRSRAVRSSSAGRRSSPTRARSS